ncbi:MAG: C40 family peptidase [Lactobacillus sp.]|jgi:cell wall-associated NlpC family hydrolase|nr:C40 family peptidase [Lactobacillus sp.]MCI2032177.1 C40 family peptidase [Lactobacillus sp.]
MTESKKALALAAGLAGVAGVATLAVAPNQASAATTGTVTYSEGATTVWQTPAFKAVKRYVVQNQSLAVIGQKNVNGTVWYQIGANEWIPELYLKVAGAAPTATKTAPTATAKTFAVHATYTEGAVTIWNGTSYSNPSGRYLTTAKNITAVATVQANGETWYRLSDGGYVPARFAAPAGTQQATTAAATATKAATTATQTTTPAPAAPATTTPAVTTPATKANDTASQATTAQATQANTTAAAPATTTTPATTTPAASEAPATSTAATTPAASTAPAASSAASQTTATPVKPTTDTQAATTQVTVTYTPSVVSEWRSAGYTEPAGKYLSAGTTVTAVGTTTANGETWYHLSDGNYVSAGFFGTAGTQASAAKQAATTPAKTTTQAPATTQTTTPAATPAQTPAATQTPAQTTPAATPAKTTTSTPTTQTPATTTTTNSSRSAQIQAVINVAKAQLGKPYVWGGKGPSGFDCSGLTHYAFLNGANKEIGGWTVPQESAGTKVAISSLQPGDLIFWGSAGATYHVAIYLGGNQYINAPQPGENVKIASISSYFMPSFGVRVL